MPRKREHDRALGPYKHGQQWRVFFINAAGVRQMESYATYEKACEERDAANLASGNRTLSEAVDAYLVERKDDRGYETCGTACVRSSVSRKAIDRWLR